MSDKCILKESLKEILSCLPERKRDILALRFGLDGKKINTLNDIGLKFKVTRERVRQIEKESFEYIFTVELPKCIKQFNNTTLKILKKEKGFLEESILVTKLTEEFNTKDNNIIKFLLNLNSQISFSKNNFNFKQFWVLEEGKIKEIKTLLFDIEELFGKNKDREGGFSKALTKLYYDFFKIPEIYNSDYFKHFFSDSEQFKLEYRDDFESNSLKFFEGYFNLVEK